jgi:hypothetical protein
MPNAPPKRKLLEPLPKALNANGRRSTRIIRWHRLCLPLLLLLPSCAKEPPRYVVVSANRGCSAVFKPFKKEEIEQATQDARVKMEGHNAAWKAYCDKT